MNDKKLIIYLSELSHDGFGLSLNTIPLGIGCIAAYCKKLYKEQVEIKLFRRFKDLKSAVSIKKPDIVGFGYYSWNENLTIAASEFVRNESPDALIVLGGPSIGNKGCTSKNVYQNEMVENDIDNPDIELLFKYRFLDILVHGDGEIPFCNIVKKSIDIRDRDKVKAVAIDGCTSVDNGRPVVGKPVEPIKNLDEIPSPYLTGIYDEFITELKLVPQIETVRGCPYECTYCTIGGNTNKLRKHSIERVVKEIEYLEKNSTNKILRIADSNWGILDRDKKLADIISRMNEERGYPASLRVYYSESGPFSNIVYMAEKLRKLLPLNISLQTLSKNVLKIIKRKNMSGDLIKRLIQFANERNISVSTELISGLPGESCNSFRNVILETIGMNFDSIFIGQLYLIKGSELNDKNARKKYGFKTLHSLMGKDVTKVESNYIYETDEVVVQSSTMSEKDFWELYRIYFFFFLLYGAAFFKEIVMHCYNYGISPLDIYDEIYCNPEKYQFVNEITNTYIENMKNKYFADLNMLEAQLEEAIKKKGEINEFCRMRTMFNHVGNALSSKNKELLIANIVESAIRIHGRKKNDQITREFTEVINELSEITNSIIISPLEKQNEKIFLDSRYDLLSWYQNGYKEPLHHYKNTNNKTLVLKVRNINEHNELYDMTKEMDEIDKYSMYFTTTVSSNMRRVIET